MAKRQKSGVDLTDQIITNGATIIGRNRCPTDLFLSKDWCHPQKLVQIKMSIALLLNPQGTLKYSKLSFLFVSLGDQ
jgi:hypothetical protein